ncbi:MAG: IS21 family transposase [Gemmataceae bacterium]|nr:IS21 family transposase [Gemmataceae bacterium]
MHKAREVLRLKFDCRLSNRKIGRACGIDRDTVGMYLKRSEKAGLRWPFPPELSDADIEARLFPKPTQPAGTQRPLPDCQYVYDQLRDYKSLNLTLMQLWIEYKGRHPDGFQYTQFCEHYHRWRSKLDYVMRQEHRAGDKVFVDFCDGLPLVDRATGEISRTHLFVAVWGFSNFTYVEAVPDQTVPSWARCHVRALTYSGVAPHALVPDNLKSAVTKPCLYEPELNRSYAELAAHYGAAVLPARVRRPRDKAKAEAGVLVAQRWILAVLRQRTFFTLAEMNEAIGELLEVLNDRPMKKLKRSRRELFEAQDRPAALPLPERPYQYAEWEKARVNFDYTIEVDRHIYSMPFRFLREELDVRLTVTTVEAFQRGERIAAHVRSYKPGGHTILDEHRPPEHRKHLEWTPERIIAWAAKTGPSTAKVVERVMAGRRHPEEGFRACRGIIGLCDKYGGGRVEAASQRALRYGACSYKYIRSILVGGLDRVADAADDSRQPSLPLHENVRGGGYYH